MVQGLEFMIKGSKVRVKGSGRRVYDLGCTICGRCFHSW